MSILCWKEIIVLQMERKNVYFLMDRMSIKKYRELGTNFCEVLDVYDVIISSERTSSPTDKDSINSPKRKVIVNPLE
jgi:hypothetical protein